MHAQEEEEYEEGLIEDDGVWNESLEKHNGQQQQQQQQKQNEVRLAVKCCICPSHFIVS